MHAISFLILFLCVYLSNGQFLNRQNYSVMEQFRKSAKSIDLLSVETKRIKQQIDHFNSCDNRIWFMRYFENKEKWRKGGPVYIFIGGEEKMSPASLATGLLYELAEETNGVMFATEHRYYGKSKPFKQVTRENIKYLHSEQALEDIAHFIKRKIKMNFSFKASKVVVVGGSYAGNLAAWMRLRYPGLVDAAIASSAPLLAKLDFEEFLETVGNVYKKYAGENCFHEITNTFKSYNSDLKDKDGIKKLKKEQNICETSDLTKGENQAEFFDEMIHNLTKIAQSGTSCKIKNYCYMPREQFCKKSEGCCKLDFDNLYFKRASHAPVHDQDMWTYQMCNEFGHFFTAPKNPPFEGINLNVGYNVKICRRLFGTKFNKKYIEEKVKETNDKYGGLTPKVSNVLFVHGEIDPWQRLGVVTDLSEDAPARMIPGASHCNDLYSDDADTTTDQVLRMKGEEKAFIKRWIGYNK